MRGPINDNGPIPEATPEDDLILDGFIFRVYSLPDGRLIVDANDVQDFFGSPDITTEMILRLKEAVEERIDART